MNHLKKITPLIILLFLAGCFGNSTQPENPENDGKDEIVEENPNAAGTGAEIDPDAENVLDSAKTEENDPSLQKPEVDDPDAQTSVPEDNTVVIPAAATDEDTKNTPQKEEKKPAKKPAKKKEDTQVSDDKKDTPEEENADTEKKPTKKSPTKKEVKKDDEKEEDAKKENGNESDTQEEKKADEEPKEENQNTPAEDTTQQQTNDKVARDIEDFAQEIIPVAKITEAQREEIQEAIDEIMLDAAMEDINATKGLE